MLFYRVRPECDNKYIANESKHRFFALIGGELYTEREKERYGIPNWCVEPVEIKRTRTYWSFGARFELEKKPIELAFEIIE